MCMHQAHVGLFLRGRGDLGWRCNSCERGLHRQEGVTLGRGLQPPAVAKPARWICMHYLAEAGVALALRIMPLVGAKSNFSRSVIVDLVSGVVTLIYMIIRKLAAGG